MRKNNCLRIIAGLLTLSLFSCTESSDEGSTGGNLDGKPLLFTFTAKVISIDKAKGILISENDEYSCVNGTSKKTTSQDTSLYGFSGGKVYVWEESDCFGSAFDAPRTDIIGTFTASDLKSVALPTNFQNANCTGEETPDDGLSMFGNNLSGKVTVSNSKIEQSIYGTACMSSLAGESMAEGLSGFPSINVEIKSCEEIQLTNTDTDKSAKITSTTKDGAFNLTGKFNDKTCTGTINFDPTLNAQNVCAADDGISTFFFCAINSGFFGDVTIPNQ